MYHILVADDERSEWEVISYLIRKNKFPLHEYFAINGEEACRILQKNNIDILITDIRMPFMDGLVLAEKARQINPSIEIIFFSGYDDFAYIKQALSLRAVNYILKPINPDEFKKSIQEVLDTISTKSSISKQYEKYMEENFHTHALVYLQDAEKNNNSHDSAEDSHVLARVEQAVWLKNPEELEKSVLFLFEKYQKKTRVSHIYIRYLFTTLMSYLLQALPDTSQSDFEKTAAAIYSLQHFENIREYIQSCLDQVLKKLQEEVQAPKHSIQIVKQYIHSHYMDALSLSQLSEIVYLSPKHLSNTFSQTTGISLNKYIRNVRMEKAKDLLLHSNMKVTDISISVGYPNSSYFCKLFLEETNQSPEKYRQRNGRKAVDGA